MRKSVFFFLLPLFLFGGEAQKQLNVFELTPSKMPPQQFKVEAIFSKEIKADCNDAYLIGGKIEQKEGADGLFYYEFSGGNELAVRRQEAKEADLLRAHASIRLRWRRN